jgi:hypothetical protein
LCWSFKARGECSHIVAAELLDYAEWRP